MISDPIADMATRIRNAFNAAKETVEVPYSQVKEQILEVMKSKTYIQDYEISGEGKHKVIVVTFKKNRETLNIKRISTPGRRLYMKSTEIKKVRSGFGISIISTSSGVMAGYEAYQK